MFFYFLTKTKVENMRTFMLLVAVGLLASVSYAESNSPPVESKTTIDEKAVEKFECQFAIVSVASIERNVVARAVNHESTPAAENSVALFAQQPAKTLSGHPVVRYALLRYRTSNQFYLYKNSSGVPNYSMTGYSMANSG
jgi:hypothetical protein